VFGVLRRCGARRHLLAGMCVITRWLPASVSTPLSGPLCDQLRQRRVPDPVWRSDRARAMRRMSLRVSGRHPNSHSGDSSDTLPQRCTVPGRHDATLQRDKSVPLLLRDPHADADRNGNDSMSSNGPTIG